MAPKQARINQTAIVLDDKGGIFAFMPLTVFGEGQEFEFNDEAEVDIKEGIRVLSKILAKEEMADVIFAMAGESHVMTELPYTSVIMKFNSEDESYAFGEDDNDDDNNCVVKFVRPFQSNVAVIEDLDDYDNKNPDHIAFFGSIVNHLAKDEAIALATHCGIPLKHDTEKFNNKKMCYNQKAKTVAMLRNDIMCIFGLATQDDKQVVQKQKKTHEEVGPDPDVDHMVYLNTQLRIYKKKMSEFHRPFGVVVKRGLNDIVNAQTTVQEIEQDIQDLINKVKTTKKHDKASSSAGPDKVETTKKNDPFVDDDDEVECLGLPNAIEDKRREESKAFYLAKARDIDNRKKSDGMKVVQYTKFEDEQDNKVKAMNTRKKIQSMMPGVFVDADEAEQKEVPTADDNEDNINKQTH